MTNTQNIILDLTNPHISPPPTVYAKQGDSGSRTVVAKIIDNGADVTISAPCRIYFSGVGGGSPCYITGTMTSGAVTFTIPQTATMKSGTVKGEVQILNSENAEEVIATMSFDLVVKQTAYNVGAIVGGGGVNLADQYVDEVVSNHNASGDAHKNIQRNLEKYATDKDTEVLQSAKEYADIKAQSSQSSLESHNTNTTAHSDIRDKIALLQKYPCYEYATSGGAVQRFDDVSVIPHTIGVTVHGATDENGNSVTNPTVSVYGKNLCPINRAENSKVGKLNAVVKKGVTYTFSCLETYTEKGDDPSITTGGQFKINGTSLGQIWFLKNVKRSFTFVAPEDGALILNMFHYVTLEEIQLEVGDTATDYEPYTEPQTANPSITIGEGEVFKVETFNTVSPTMTVIATDDNGLVSTVDIKYNRDVKKALDKLEAAIAALA